MRPLSLVTAIAAALVLATPTQAKEPIRATICGATACKAVTDKTQLAAIPSGETTAPLGAAAPYYRIEVVAGQPHGTHSFFLYYIPDANGTAWLEGGSVLLHPIFGDATTAAMRKLTEGLAPFPRPRVASVRVGNRSVTGEAAQTYLQLFAEPVTPGAATQSSKWTEIDLRSGRGSPWTDAEHEFLYSPEDDALVREWHVVELDERTAANIERGERLDAAAPRRWRLGLAAAAAPLVFGLVVVAARRRRA